MRGVSGSQTSRYNTCGNGQVELYNGIIWKALQLDLRTKNRPSSGWEMSVLSALNFTRSLISTSTNETPHERFYTFQRRSGQDTTLPSWLTTPGPIYLCKFNRTSKNDPLVEEVELLHANPSYARVKNRRLRNIPLF